jgi:hypothetical protein
LTVAVGAVVRIGTCRVPPVNLPQQHPYVFDPTHGNVTLVLAFESPGTPTMTYLNDDRRHREPEDGSFDDDSAYFCEIATVLVFLVLANWFVHTSRNNINFDERYSHYKVYEAERNAELRYLVRLPTINLLSEPARPALGP